MLHPLVYGLQADAPARFPQAFESSPLHWSLTEISSLSEAGYRLLVEHLPAISYIAAWDAASSTVYVSPQIRSILGFTQDEWMADAMLRCYR
jgi:hypothetical protein